MAKAEEFQVVLTPGPADAALESPAYQKELEELGAALEPYNPRIPIRLDRIEAVAAPPGDTSGAVLLIGEFGFAISLGLPHISAIAKLLIRWRKAARGRKITLKVKGVKAEAQTVEEIEALFRIAEKHQEHKKRLKRDS